MLYVVLFEDNANLGTDVRRQHMPAHLSFLEKNAGRIKAAGPLRAPSGDPAGGLWVVEAESPDVVDALVKEDHFGQPDCGALSAFWAGLRSSQTAGGPFDATSPPTFWSRVSSPMELRHVKLQCRLR